MHGREKRIAHPFDEVLKHLDLDERLVVEALLVPDDLDRDHLARLVVAALEDLAEGTLAKDVDDLVTEPDVVVGDKEVVAALVVEAKVVRRVVLGRHLLVAVRADKVDLVVLSDLLLLVFGQVPRVERRGICKAKSAPRRSKEKAAARNAPRESSEGRGSVGSGNSNILRIASGLRPAASFFACWRRTYAAISSSPRSCSSVTPYCEFADDRPEPESVAEALKVGLLEDLEMRDGIAILLARVREDRDEAKGSTLLWMDAAEARRELLVEALVEASDVLEAGRRGRPEFAGVDEEVDEVESERRGAWSDIRGWATAPLGRSRARVAAALASSPAMRDLRRLARGSAVVLIRDDVDDAKLSTGGFAASDVPFVVLRLRGIWDGSESILRRVESVFSPEASPGSRVTIPKSDMIGSVSEKRLAEEMEAESMLEVSGAVE